MVLKRDLKDAYRSGKFISSKVKRSAGSAEGFEETTAAAATAEGDREAPGAVHSDTETGAQEKEGADPE